MTHIYSKLFLSLYLFLNLSLNFSISNAQTISENGMVSSASELASQVGVNILKKGGNAIDAAVAVGFALAVTYPSAGNIGGGGFMVIHFADGKQTTIDYREKAPLSSYEKMFLDSLGNYDVTYSSEGPKSVAIPGSVAGLLYALKKYGTLSLDEVIQPAIDLAEYGFLLDSSLACSFQYMREEFRRYESSLKIFSVKGEYFFPGDNFRQTDLAKTLRLIKENGADGFYKGEVADLFIKQINSFGGNVTHEDLLQYKPVEREPVVGYYKGLKVVSMGPPSSGGISLIQMLNTIENFNFTKEERGSSKYIHTLVEAMKYSFADRSLHAADEDFFPVPKQWLISDAYGKQIAERIGEFAITSDSIKPGTPEYWGESDETTHYSVIDVYGNAVSTTTTINSSYGSKIVVEGAGFLLNNEMDDFSSKPGEPNQFGLVGNVANAIQPAKRMVSSMTPTIILKDEKPYLIVGSPGGSTIPTVVLQVILNCVNFNMNIKDAIDAARIHHQWLPDKIDYEILSLTPETLNSLIERGQIIGDERSLGRVDGILIDQSTGTIYGWSDSRGYGKAIGY
ncbi:MAG: gamma-glutamyltransferase [Ignavibacteriales bacterium]|nr:MAG: gamma-glutamyltransferase [Ignavibacteriales bacterium]